MNTQKVNVVDVWKDTNDEEVDYYCAYVDIGKGEVYVEYDVKDIEKLIYECEPKTEKPTDNQIKNSIACHVLRDIDEYINLPKLKDTSDLLRLCFNSVLSSENGMYFVDKDDWQELCEECDYRDSDLKILEQEIKTYHLEDCIVLYDYDVITCYADLKFKFMFGEV